MSRSLLLLVALAACLATLVVGMDYVHTPLGRMRSDCVHKVPSGSHIRENAHGRLDVHDSSSRYVRTLPKCLNQHIVPLFHPSTPPHVRRSPRNILKERDGRLLNKKQQKKSDDPFPADYDGWEAYTAWNTSAGIDAFLGNFSVPDAPAQSPDILYIFTGLQNIDWIPIVDPEQDTFDIIQPVLQYPADAGSGWSVKSWYVTLDEGAIASDEIVMNPGDNVFGNMTQTGATTWFIGSTVSSTQQTTSISVSRPRLQNQFWAYNTLECYGCIDCTTYPQQPSVFSELALFKNGEQLTPEWKLNPKPNPSLKCHETILDITPESQSIVFQQH